MPIRIEHITDIHSNDEILPPSEIGILFYWACLISTYIMITQMKNSIRISNNKSDRRVTNKIQSMLDAEKVDSWVTAKGQRSTISNEKEHSASAGHVPVDGAQMKHFRSSDVTPVGQTLAFSKTFSVWLGFEYQYLMSYKLFKVKIFQNCVQYGNNEAVEKVRTSVVISLVNRSSILKQNAIGLELSDGKRAKSKTCFFKNVHTCQDLQRLQMRIQVHVNCGWLEKSTCIVDQKASLANCDYISPRSVWVNLNRNTMM